MSRGSATEGPEDAERAQAGGAVDPDVDLRVPADRDEVVGARLGGVLAVIALGGALGALGRYALQELWPSAGGTRFAWGTFTANVTGSALIAVLMVLVSERRTPVSPWVRPFLGVGALGGFTSYSAYALDGTGLADSGETGTAVAYLAGTLLTALTAVTLAAWLTRWAVRRAHRRTPGSRGGPDGGRGGPAKGSGGVSEAPGAGGPVR